MNTLKLNYKKSILENTRNENTRNEDEFNFWEKILGILKTWWIEFIENKDDKNDDKNKIKHKNLAEKYSYSTEKIYFFGEEILWADFESFETPFEDKRYSRDKNFIYFKWKKLDGVDRDTFHFITALNWEISIYSTDKTWNIYDNGKKVHFDYLTFTVLSKFESYDKYWIYFWEEKLKITDLSDQKRIRNQFHIPISRTKMFLNSIMKWFF